MNSITETVAQSKIAGARYRHIVTEFQRRIKIWTVQLINIVNSSRNLLRRQGDTNEGKGRLINLLIN